MAYYTQPIITRFNEIAPGDTVTIAAKTFDSTHTLPAMAWAAERAPLYNTSGLTNPTNAIYISPTGNDSATGSTAGNSTHPFKTVGKARSYIDNTVKSATWIICQDGNYRDKWNTTFGDQNTFVLGVKAAKDAHVWFDGSDFLTGGTWTQSPSNVWTWNGTFAPAVDAAAHQVFLDGVPLLKTTNSSPGLGAFYTSGPTLKIGSTVNPSTKIIEFSNRNSPVAGIKKNGFYVGYLGFRRFCPQSGGVLTVAAQNQVLDHVVLAYTSGFGYLLNTSSTKNLTMTDVILTHGPGKAWTDDGKSQDMNVDGMRVWATNWRHDHNTAPSNSASLGGVKHWKTRGFRGKNMLFGWNTSNGEWFDGSDVGDPSHDNQTTAVTYWFNGGYGQTTEVAVDRRLADVLCVGNGWMGFGNVDGTRFSGVNASKLYSCTSLDNVGAGAANYEDGREYGGSDSAHRALNPSVCGDSLACEQMGVVMLRTARPAGNAVNGVPTGSKPPFYSFCQKGSATMAGSKESGGTGYAQTQPIATVDMFTHAKHGKNIYIDVTGNTTAATVAAPGGNAHWTISYNGSGQVVCTDVGGCSTTAKKTLAQMQSLGLDTGSLAFTTAGKSVGDYFPDAGITGDPGEPTEPMGTYSWWDVFDGKIPSTSTAIPTYAPPDWVCDALGVAHGTTVRVGCRNAPLPVPIGTDVPPDLAELITPAAGDTLSGSSVAWSANAHDPNDNHNVTVELRADGNPIGTGVFASYSGSGDLFNGTPFDSNLLTDDNHDLRARVVGASNPAVYKASLKHTVTVNNGADTTPPSVSGLSLNDGDQVQGTEHVTASITDTSGLASKILRITDSDGSTHDFAMT